MEKRKRRIINCIVMIIAAAFFLVLPLLDFGKKNRYDMVFLGDSIIGTEMYCSIVGLVADKLEVTAFNGAFGGSTMSIGEKPIWGSVSSNQWCMVRLAQAIANKDWKSQEMAMSYAVSYEENNRQAFDYFEQRMNELASVDFEETKVLIIEHGTNDYNGGRKLDNPEDLYDITTFGGALRSSLKLLQETYPQMQIVILSPLYCQFPEYDNRPGYSMDFGQGVLDDYVELEQKIAKEFNVPFIDAYHNSGIWENNAEQYLTDGLHLTKEGAVLFSEYLANELQKVLTE